MMENIAAIWGSKEADALTGGVSTQPWSAMDITLRDDDIYPGDLFFASPGDDLESVFEQGAAAAVVQKDTHVSSDLAQQFPMLRVDSVYEALRSMAWAARQKTHSLVVSVQGYEHRNAFCRALASVSDAYEAGRHLSSSMARIPEICDFSIFGMTPSLSPDVVVMYECGRQKDYAVIETMPKNGIVLLNADDEKFMEAVAFAKSVGLKNILSFGASGAADARTMNSLVTSNGMHLECDILGEAVVMQPDTHTCPHMPNLPQSPHMLLAALMVAKLSDMKLKYCAQDMADCYMSTVNLDQQDTTKRNVTLFKNNMAAASMVDEAIFKVKNMIDTGKGKRTLVLDKATPNAKTGDFIMPSKLGGLDVVCASRKVSIFKNARQAVENILNTGPLNHIVPDVLTPGDFVVFKSATDAPYSIFSEALRPA